MKLATFEYDGVESWGIVLFNEQENEEWVYEPEKCEAAIRQVSNGTSGYFMCLPEFVPDRKWPKTLIEFLELGDDGMMRLNKFQIFLKRYIQQSDTYYISCCGHPLSKVRLRTPIPQASLFLGLVQNSPSFWRARPARIHTNLIPQGHQRPMTSVIGSGETWLGKISGNVELGIVIGKECYNVPIEEIYDYIAGYTVIYDSQVNTYYENFDTHAGKDLGTMSQTYTDWFADATGSWIGKGADSHCICGPYITTKDEIGNPYDLLVWTKSNNMQRDRSSTAGYSLGIERTVHFYAQFMHLHPGDVIHMGTVGIDGIASDSPIMKLGAGGSIGAEIECCGEVKGYVHQPEIYGDLRTEDQKRIPLVPGVQDYIDKHGTEINAFSVSNINDVWTCYGNFNTCNEKLGWLPAPSPRLLNGPRGQITDSKDDLTLSPIAGNLEISAEVAIIIKKVGKRISADTAKDYVLGLAPVLSICDMSIKEQIIEPATLQEQNIGLCYGRWGEGYNLIGEVTLCELAGRKIALSADGFETIVGNTDEYVCGIERTLEYLSLDTTLLPGDVIMLGRIGNILKIPADAYKNGLKITAEIEGLGTLTRTIKPFNN